MKISNFTKHPFIFLVVFLLLGIESLLAQDIVLKMETSATCNGKTTIDIQLKSNTEEEVQLGGASFLFRYDPTLLDLETYQANTLHEDTTKQNGWLPQQWTNDVDFGLLNVVALLDKKDKPTPIGNQFVTIGSIVLVAKDTIGETSVSINLDYSDFFTAAYTVLSLSDIPSMTINLATLQEKGGAGINCDNDTANTPEDNGPPVVDPPLDPCAATTISTKENGISIDGVDQDLIPLIRVFTSEWKPIYQCWGRTCTTPTEYIKTGEGKFFVLIDYLTVDYKRICAFRETIIVDDTCIAKGGDKDQDGVCDDEDDCIGEDCDLEIGTTYEACGFSFTHNNQRLTTENTGNALVLIYDIQAKQTVFICTPQTGDCEDNLTIDLQANTSYFVLIRSDELKCNLTQTITTSSSLLTSSSRSSDRTYTSDIVVDIPSLLKEAIIQQLLLGEDVNQESLQIEKSNSSISVYPNPATQNLFVKLHTPISQKGGQLKVLNNIGQEVLTQTLTPIAASSLILDISNLKPGLYFVEFFSDGEVMETHKLIVK